ncbi:MAG: HPr(Ser) kinase/phosphatase, partial [Candidatus Omnitrophica bacterium]|nr:HPr(Ser) kinase/phosphatase [Candidatus Omnitrophota bacterium]
LHDLATVSEARRNANLGRFFGYRIPCIIVSRGQKVPKYFLDRATAIKVPIFVSPLMTATIASQITIFIEEETAPESSLHGTLLDVFGIGTLLIGKSGIGKSECALELVERGHQLVADDLVEIKLLAGKVLMGYSNDLIHHHMEIRGLGIINIRSMFGAGAVRNQKRISMVVTLEKWSKRAEYDRLGLEDRTYPILGIDLPHLIIPVRPGRNIPILIEVAALGQRAKQMGEHPAQEFNRRLIASMAETEAAGEEGGA